MMRSVHFGSLPFEPPKVSQNDGESFASEPKRRKGEGYARPPKQQPAETPASSPRGPNVLELYSQALYDTELALFIGWHKSYSSRLIISPVPQIDDLLAVGITWEA